MIFFGCNNLYSLILKLYEIEFITPLLLYFTMSNATIGQWTASCYIFKTTMRQLGSLKMDSVMLYMLLNSHRFQWFIKIFQLCNHTLFQSCSYTKDLLYYRWININPDFALIEEIIIFIILQIVYLLSWKGYPICKLQKKKKNVWSPLNFK